MNKLSISDTAPDFDTLSDESKRVKLSEFRGKKVILFFYPKDDTPGCTKQACGFRDQHAELETANAIVLGISPDGEKSHQDFKAKFNLPFTLLIDSDHTIAEAYGAWGERSMYGRKYMGIIRSHFVIDEEGKLIDVQYKVKPADSVTKAVASVSA